MQIETIHKHLAQLHKAIDEFPEIKLDSDDTERIHEMKQDLIRGRRRVQECYDIWLLEHLTALDKAYGEVEG